MKLLHLLALFFSLQPGSAVSEYYVRSDTSTACPTESCLTFNEYVNDTETYFTSNTSFIFLEGEHYLDSALVVDGKSGITMKASTNAGVTIIFSSNAVIRFQYSQAFVMSSLKIHHPGSDQYESALELVDSQNMQLVSITFKKILEVVQPSRAVLVHKSTARISDCSFLNGSLGIEDIFAANISGGAVLIKYSTVEFLGHANFVGNSAAEGGAITAVDSALSLSGNVRFARNTAECGGAMYIQTSDVQMLANIAFESNSASLFGGAIVVQHQSNLTTYGNLTCTSNTAGRGGAIYIQSSAVQLLANIAFEDNTASWNGGAIAAKDQSNMSINGDMTFTNNSAGNGGAVYIEASDVQLLGNTAFVNNSAKWFGGAIHTFEGRLTLSGTTTFTGNKATRGGGLAGHSGAQVLCRNTSEVVFLRNTAEIGGAVYTILSGLQLLGNTAFESNSARYGGGAISATSDGISLSGNTTFTLNTASQGGGMTLVGGARLHFLLHIPLKVTFLRNEANIGGAIFTDDFTSLCSNSKSACFFDVGLPVSAANTYPLLNNLHLNFSLNSARKSGPVIYGGNLENCLVNNLPVGSGFFHLQNALMHTTPISTADVSSDPRKICICQNGTANCISELTESYSVKVKRGELFNISLITVGQLDMPVPAGILANSENIGDVRLHPQFPASNGTCTNVGISLLADEHVSSKKLYLYPDGPCGNTARARITVEITLEKCPPGFDLSLDHCDCEKRLFSLINEGNVTCDINDESISLRGNAWIQPIWNDSNYLGFIWHPNCPLGYCKSSQELIHLDFSIPDTSDSLCSENRHGLLCGACKQNYSLSLHSLSCNLCEDKYLSLLLFFAFAGIALIAFLLVLRITVAAGTINGLILYANIVSVNRGIFFPPGMINVHPLSVFLAWLNLDFGISTCFYNGLDAYSYAWLQYLFPVYLWLLIVVIILINKLPFKVGGLFGSNPVAVLATVVLMSYTKLLQSSIVALAYTQLDYPDNNTNVWLYDANITYFEGKHIALAVVAVLVIAVLILPYTLLLTFGYRLLACSNRRCCFWLNTLKPFLDPYYAPFNGKTRYWNGFLLVVRGGLYVGFAINSQGDPSANLAAISVICFVLSVIPWLGHRIYEKLYINILEASFILNVCILSIATNQVRAVNGNQAVVTYLSLGTAFAEFIGIVIYHLCSIIRDKLPCKKAIGQRDAQGVNQHYHRVPIVELEQQLPSAARLREPILEDIDIY